MPALEALNARLRAAHTLPCGISIDTVYTHAAWAEQLGGVSFPLVSDFHPKGEIGQSFGVYLADKGITDRATVIIDAGGTVRYAETVNPEGQRDIEALVRECEAIDAAWEGELHEPEQPPGLPEPAVLYVKNRCMFSRWALCVRQNLHIEDILPVVNVSEDTAALAELQRRGGKTQAPALAVGDRIMYESEDIVRYLAERCGWR